jgi:chondroitin AC lyase
MLDSGEFVCGKVQRSGNWSYIKRGDSKRQEKKTFFDMHIPHGKAPKNASYSYMVVPAVKNVKAAQKKASKDIEILQNTPDVQSVNICGRKYTVDWSAATVKFD